MKTDCFVGRQWTLGQILDHTVSRFPEHEAVVYPDRNYRLTWSQLSAQVDTFARGLMALGVQKGEKVAVWAPNVPWWVSLMLATAKIGAILLPVNTGYRQHELKYVLQQSESENLFLVESHKDHNFLKTLRAIAPEIQLQPRAQISCKSLPNLKRVMFLGAEKHRGFYSVPEIFSLAAMTDYAEYDTRQASLNAREPVNMQYTSGTTGFPKAVLLGHAGIGLNAWWAGRNQGLTEKDRICLPVPFFHCFGCVLGILACVNHGSTMVVLENFNPEHVLKAVEKEKCTALYGVPAMFHAELEHKRFSRYNLSTLRTGIMAGSICPETLLERARNEMGIRDLTICYGLTEASPVIAQTSSADNAIGDASVGKALPGVEIRIAGADNVEMKAGQAGEILCRGYNVMLGYYKMAAETTQVIDKDGWLHTGDLGYLDGNGCLHLTGRIKDLIIRGGENIYPREIEEFLLGMPGIADAQVVGAPSVKYGEEAAAFIIASPGYQPDARMVREYCRGKIASFKIPRHVHIMEQFPYNASGKIQKNELKKLAAQLWG